MRYEAEDNEGAPGLPEWLAWVQLGLTTMLVVLFGVLLVRGREQSRLLQGLEQRVQGLEARGSLAGSSVIEQQMRTLMQRIQELEAQRERIDALGTRQQQLETDLLELRDRGGSPPPPPAAASPPPAPATPFLSPPRRQGTGVIRPPAQDDF